MSQPFRIKQTYLTQEGKKVKIVEENNAYPGYECVKGNDNIWRYNREQDRGRVTASAFDMSDPRNLIPID